jgi:hypothetical protein
VNSPKAKATKILAGFTDSNVFRILHGHTDVVEIKVSLGNVGRGKVVGDLLDS